MLHEILDKIRRPLTAEVQSDYANASAIGGLDAHVLAQTQRALELIQLGELPRDAEFSLQRLRDLWTRYADADAALRAKIVADSQRLLALLAQDAPTLSCPEGTR